MKKKLMEDLSKHEGVNPFPYRCTAGKWTIGKGHNFEDRGFPPDIIKKILDESGLSPGLIEQLFEHDVNQALDECEMLIPTFYQHSENRQRALANMMFNLGYGKMKGFRKMLAALDVKDYTTTAREMLNSKWAHQVGDRAVELANLMIEG